jgi:hypothetical protein
VTELKIREHPSSTLKMSMTGPREVPELKIQEHPPSTLENIDGGPPRSARAGDPGAPTINAKKYRQWPPGRCWS